jgi:hypothetical protein
LYFCFRQLLLTDAFYYFIVHFFCHNIDRQETSMYIICTYCIFMYSIRTVCISTYVCMYSTYKIHHTSVFTKFIKHSMYSMYTIYIIYIIHTVCIIIQHTLHTASKFIFIYCLLYNTYSCLPIVLIVSNSNVWRYTYSMYIHTHIPVYSTYIL